MMEYMDDVTEKYFQNIIKNSWTWQRLTEEEKQRFVDLDIIFSEIKGKKDTREQWLFTIYAGFLAGCGYDSFSWIDRKDKENPLF